MPLHEVFVVLLAPVLTPYNNQGHTVLKRNEHVFLSRNFGLTMFAYRCFEEFSSSMIKKRDYNSGILHREG